MIEKYRPFFNGIGKERQGKNHFDLTQARVFRKSRLLSEDATRIINKTSSSKKTSKERSQIKAKHKRLDLLDRRRSRTKDWRQERGRLTKDGRATQNFFSLKTCKARTCPYRSIKQGKGEERKIRRHCMLERILLFPLS